MPSPRFFATARYQDKETGRTIYAVVLNSDTTKLCYAFDIPHDWNSPVDDEFYERILPSLVQRAPFTVDSNGHTFLLTAVTSLMREELKRPGEAVA